MSIRTTLDLTALIILVLFTGCISGSAEFVTEYEDDFDSLRVSYKGGERKGPVDDSLAIEVRDEALALLSRAVDLQKGIYFERDVTRSFTESNYVRLSSPEILNVTFPNDEVGEKRFSSFIIYFDSKDDMFTNAVLTCVRNCSDLRVDSSRGPLEDAARNYVADGEDEGSAP